MTGETPFLDLAPFGATRFALAAEPAAVDRDDRAVHVV